MAAERNLSPALIRQLLDYDPETGFFTWKRRIEVTGWDKTFNKRFADRLALETVDANGYRHGSVKCISVAAHRVAWAWMTGAWPEGEIDHIDGNRANNAFHNLRSADRRENAKNLGSRKEKKSGLPKGVFLAKSFDGPNPYRAQIVINKKPVHLGCFPDAASASKAYKDAARKYGFSERHGSAA